MYADMKNTNIILINDVEMYGYNQYTLYLYIFNELHNKNQYIINI